jgi:hypothetical protein
MSVGLNEGWKFFWIIQEKICDNFVVQSVFQFGGSESKLI